MNLDKLTEKAQGALDGARQEALRRQHQEFDDLHLLAALLAQENGFAAPLLRAAGVDPSAAAARLEAELARVPAVTGSGAGSVRLGAGPRLERTLLAAFDEAQALKYEYASVEQLMLGMERAGGGAWRILAALGLTRDRLLFRQWIQQLRPRAYSPY